MSERIIETIGTITKKEHLSLVENETNSNKLIIESSKPFPGYNDLTVPDDLEPQSLFAITKLLYKDERVIRSIQAVKKLTKITFDAAPGTIIIRNETFNFIRFKHIDYRQMGEILNYFTDEGIEFRRSRKVTPYETIIRVRKFFKMKETTDDLYQDMYDAHTFYIKIPVFLRWATFERITLNIKYNMDDKNFDAAQTSVYAEDGLIDFVRIYDKDSCQGKLLHIKEKYDEAIEKL